VIGGIVRAYESALRGIVLLMMGVSGLAILGVMGVTCVDVAMRVFRASLVGTVDMVSILGAVAMAGALPYTTAVKGHVAIEFFFRMLPWAGRVAVDSVVRSAGILLFLLLAWRNVLYGLDFLSSNRVSQTLQAPLFWLPWTFAACCFVVALVILYNLTHPGKVMIQP
jgi:TRAP-type C4-dicarboxylate transport system permease small subunit